MLLSLSYLSGEMLTDEEEEVKIGNAKNVVGDNDVFNKANVFEKINTANHSNTYSNTKYHNNNNTEQNKQILNNLQALKKKRLLSSSPQKQAAITAMCRLGDGIDVNK